MHFRIENALAVQVQIDWRAGATQRPSRPSRASGGRQFQLPGMAPHQDRENRYIHKIICPAAFPFRQIWEVSRIECPLKCTYRTTKILTKKMQPYSGGTAEDEPPDVS